MVSHSASRCRRCFCRRSPWLKRLRLIWYDAPHDRIYASGGRGSAAGFVYVYQQKDADRYELTAKIPTRANAQTSIWVPQLNRYYVSASANDKEDAAILVFEPQP